jgi:hypothetical protein
MIDGLSLVDASVHDLVWNMVHLLLLVLLVMMVMLTMIPGVWPAGPGGAVGPAGGPERAAPLHRLARRRRVGCHLHGQLRSRFLFFQCFLPDGCLVHGHTSHGHHHQQQHVVTMVINIVMLYHHDHHHRHHYLTDVSVVQVGCRGGGGKVFCNDKFTKMFNSSEEIAYRTLSESTLPAYIYAG